MKSDDSCFFWQYLGGSRKHFGVTLAKSDDCRSFFRDFGPNQAKPAKLTLIHPPSGIDWQDS